MIRPWPVAALCLAAACAGACSEPAPQVRLVRVGGSCGAAGDARTLFIRALGDDGEISRTVAAGQVAELADLPATTRQISVEVVGDGGAVRTVGKSAPLSFGDLEDGERIAVAMAPLGAACPTEGMIEPRLSPTVARAGRYVLVLGGETAGADVVSAELYDPDTDRFEPVELPARIASSGNLAGIGATTLADGRVVVIGGPIGAYTVFEPAAKRFGLLIVLEPRTFHGAVALGGDQLLVAGGCRGATMLRPRVCNGEAARTVFRLSVDSDRQDVLGTLERDHVSPTLLLDPGGIGGGSLRSPAALIVGGATAQGLPMETADRFDPETRATAGVAGTFAAAAPLDSGAVVTGFGAGTLAAIANTAVVPPLLSSRALQAPTAMRGTSLTLLEDGTVLALGQSDDDEPTAQLYRPTVNRWQPLPLPAELGSLAEHRAVRLDDGSVLIVGVGASRASAPRAPSAVAWRFRPSLVGPFSPAVVAQPSGERAELTPSDPSAFLDGVLAGTRAGLSQWVITGGPRLVDGQLTAVVRVPAVPASDSDLHGLAILSHFISPAELVATQLVPGQPVLVQRTAAGAVSELCRGAQVPPGLAETTATVALTVRAGLLTVAINSQVVLTCAVAELPRGAWGLGVIGSSRLGIDTLSLER